jgi:hypothetical protein
VATDLGKIVESLVRFYDFDGKTVVDVGAGGGRLVGYARTAARVVAVDSDADAMALLSSRVAERGLAVRFEMVTADFLSVQPRGDVVLLEFCLHQMPDPEKTLEHASGLAADVLVIDHAPGSLWSWCAAEEDLVRAAWEAARRRPIRRETGVEASQVFRNYAALEGRLSAQGPESLERIGRYRGRRQISIPMPYILALI